MNLENILGQGAFWIVNKTISKKIGIESALLLSDLISKKNYFKNINLLVNDEFFFNTSENIEDSTTLSYKVQKRCIKTLQDVGFVEVKLMGQPAKLHFKICENKIFDLVKTSIAQTAELELTFEQNSINNNKINNNKKEKEEKSFSISKKESVFLFENSEYNNIDNVRNYLLKNKKYIEKYKGVNLEFYINAVNNWSDKSGKKTTNRGWIAYIRDFMDKHLLQNKLQLKTNKKEINTTEGDLKKIHDSGKFHNY